ELKHQVYHVTLYLLTTALPPYRRNGQTSESYRFLPLVTSHDLLWVNCFLYIFVSPSKSHILLYLKDKYVLKHLKYSPFGGWSFRWKTKQLR
uniref:Uncharacterized protein n=1 Tax=Nomascus leucogenys TaxID=61853 RepID=A0A2I3H7H7_NOMLE